VHPVLTIDPEAPGSVIASRRWRRDFESRAGRHRRVALDGRPDLDSRTEAALRRSVAVFQLGETGTGEHLLALTARTGDHDLLVAMRCFVEEEREHARLLALILDELDEPLLQRHWSDAVFQAMRRVSGLRAEVLTLLVAELIALVYYDTLARGLREQPDLATLFAGIHEDEVAHVDFHADTLPGRLEQWPWPVWWAGRVIWNVVLYAAACVVGWGHRRLLRRCGSSARRFLADCHRTFRINEPRFFRGAR
jgi:hypothetical protein